MVLEKKEIPAAAAGSVLALPETAVVDTGKRKVVYVESSPGVFDAHEVVLGPRAGVFYPVVSGVDAGMRVATAGSFLIDAETRLNPAAAGTYFGASGATPASQEHAK
jgi:Cu(I)/Ag(I) efflux system membrane fusion protein